MKKVGGTLTKLLQVKAEAVTQICSVKKVFLQILQNSQENNCVKVASCNFTKKQTLAQVFSSEFCEIFKNPFLQRIPPVAASVKDKLVTGLLEKTYK